MNALTPNDFDDRSPEERLPERLALLAAELIREEGEPVTMDRLAVLLGLTLATVYTLEPLVADEDAGVPDEEVLTAHLLTCAHTALARRKEIEESARANQRLN
jgi:hypothetical protein